MHIFDVLLRGAIQTAVMGIWGLFGLAFIVGLIGRIVRWIWRKIHPVRAIIHLPNDEVVDAEWVWNL
jgi:hypothetical protein